MLKDEWVCIWVNHPVYPVIYAAWQDEFDLVMDSQPSSKAIEIVNVVNPLVEVIRGRDIFLTRIQETYFKPQGVLPLRVSGIQSIIKLKKGTDFLKKIEEAIPGKEVKIKSF